MRNDRICKWWIGVLLLLAVIGFAYHVMPLFESTSVEHRVDEQRFYERFNKAGKLNIPDPSLISFRRQDLTERESDREIFDTARAWDLEDRDYRLKFEKHRSIKTYLSAPCRDYPKYQEVLMTLLEHGYGIREWPEAVRAISSWSELEHHNTGQMRLIGVPESDIPREIQRFRNENIGDWRRCRALLKSTTGIEDDALLNDLMNIPLHWPYFSDPLNVDGVGFQQGESFLNDGDWMAPEHVAALGRYQGEPLPERTLSEITATLGEEPLLVNENESIADRENISPALAPYRGDDYYETKRRLHELGEHQVQDIMQNSQENE